MSNGTLSLIIECVARTFGLDKLKFGPDTDLMALSQFDPEQVEWAIEDLQRQHSLDWPTIRDGNGRPCRAQLFLPERLTIAELCEIVDSGKWPSSWTRPEKVLPRWPWE